MSIPQSSSGIIMGWITCFNNAFVHVIMYYYYAEQARGVGPIWWRKYLTTIQIVQFMLDCGTSVFFGYFYFVGIPCQGTLASWLAANFVGISFFFLFVDFYKKQYSGKGTKQRKQE
jgi:fatty acid elongase 3